ncbi:unnamed protein product [Phytophthora fragariaefolia]|uniref:Unnamed protein product n=1 Tax=Phytophthora fragariaefolia TaxID=1490495 RepID=A0A9W6WXY7_9STRA|nr:unnamed protein product [Phytophthora fragariaefolia]
MVNTDMRSGDASPTPCEPVAEAEAPPVRDRAATINHGPGPVNAADVLRGDRGFDLNTFNQTFPPVDINDNGGTLSSCEARLSLAAKVDQ